MSTITVNGNSVPWTDGLTVSQLLQQMKFTFRMLVVKVDGQLIKKELYDETLIPEGATVQVIHLISGG